MNTYNIEKVEEIVGSKVAIVGEIPTEVFESYREQALKHLGEHVEIPGFRKGHIPSDMTEKHVGEIYILEEMAQIALSNAYPKILMDNKIEAIGEPSINITKLAKGNPLGFKIETAVIPKVTLPDYKKIAQAENKAIKESQEKDGGIEVADSEVENTIKELRKLRAHNKMHEGKAHDDHSHGEMKDEDLPEVNDEFAQSFGEFKTLVEFKDKIRENMKLEKIQKAQEKLCLAIIEKIVEETKTEIPEMLIEVELNKMEMQMQGDIERAGMTYDDYLKNLNKTKEDIRKEWRPDAEKRVKFELILREISIKETLKPEEADIEHQVVKILEQYKGADHHRARAYVEQSLTHEKVFKFLESVA